MKTWTKIAITLAVLGGGVAAYVLFQTAPPAPPRGEDLRPSSRQANEPNASGIGAGERPWVNQLDENFQLSYRFRGDSFEPQGGSAVKVIKPAFQFFSGDQVIEMSGETGMVYLPPKESKSGKGPFQGSALQGMPTSGTMKDVTIRMLRVGTDGKVATEPSMTARMDNVTFDNETLRVETGPFVREGRDVSRDRVPVTVRGEDYDFDGEGLTLTLDRGRRASKDRGSPIERLHVDHGHRILIKHPSAMEEDGPVRIRMAPPGTGAVPSGGTTLPSGAPGSPGGGTAPVIPATVPRKVSRATLTHNLKIVQGPSTVTGESMQVDYTSHATFSGGVASPATAPSPTAETPPTRPVATRPPEEPVLITWDGPLDLRGEGGDPSLPDKQAIVTINGAPTTLTQHDLSAQAATLVYDKLAKVATLVGTEAQPVLLSDDKGGSIARTSRLVYDTKARIATMFGNSFMRTASPAGDGGTPVPTVISWSKLATLTFDVAKGAGKSNPARPDGSQRIKTAVLEGDVVVDHPNLAMSSRKLTVGFDVTASRGQPSDSDSLAGGSAIESAHAEGGVLAKIPGENGKPDAALQGDDLVLKMSAGGGADKGKRYPAEIVTTGHVRATDGKQNLAADELTLGLEPGRRGGATRKSASKDAFGASKVQTLLAVGHVTASADDGTSLVTDRMRVTNATESPDVSLSGPSSSVAGKDGAWKLLSENIRYAKVDKRAVVDGPGTMTGVKAAEKPGDAPVPFKATWTRSAHMDGRTNRIDVEGDVRLYTTDKDGAANTATGDTLTVNLMDADPRPGTTRGAGPGAADAVGNKQVRSFDFGGNVRLQSLLTSATQVLRQVNLAASKMTYEAGRGVTVPVPGTLFMFDRRPDRQPSAMPTAGAGVPSGKGTTAISWQEQLQYDMAAHTVTFDRDVRFAHRALAPADGAPADVPEEPFRLDADKLVATLADNGKPGPNGEIAGAMGGAQLKAVHSTGSVVFTGRGVLVHASQIDFDPDAQVIVATGTLQDPVQFDEVKGIATGTATYVRFNLKSGQIEDLKNPTGTLGTKGLKARLGSAGETKAK